MAFEKQTLHISGLLSELQEKECALLSQGEELVRCKQELDGLKNNKEEEMTLTVKEWGERQDEKRAEISKQLSQERESAVTFHSPKSPAHDFSAPTDASQPKMGTLATEKLSSRGSKDDEAMWPGENPGSVDSNKPQNHHDSACVMAEDQCSQQEETADTVTELLALQRENQLLKQRTEGWTVSETTNPTLQSDIENQEDQVKQGQSTMNVSCLPEPTTRSAQIITEGPESLLKNVKQIEDEGQDLEMDNKRTTRAEEEQNEVSEVCIDQLQQQVMTMNYLTQGCY